MEQQEETQENDGEPGFPYWGFCPIKVYNPGDHVDQECPFCREEQPMGQIERWQERIRRYRLKVLQWFA